MQNDLAKQSNLMKLEAMALFANVKANKDSGRWWYFKELQRLGRTARMDQSISAYRASLFCDYLFCGIECQLYLEREARTGKLGDDNWVLSISGIEGKVNALTIQDKIKGLQNEGYYIPNGNENLERQMNFSLGLYGACLMHVDIHYPSDQAPIPCTMHVFDLIDATNKQYCNLHESLAQQLKKRDEMQRINQNTDNSEDPDIIMGDWQTWK